MTPSMDSDSPINSPEDEDGYLSVLAACPTIEKCPYSNRQEIFHRRQAGISEGESEWILLTDIDDQTFTRDFLFDVDNDGQLDQHHHENRDDHPQPEWSKNWSTFDSKLKLLLARMPVSEPHEQAAQVFEEVFLEAVEKIGMKRSLSKTGSKTCKDTGGGKQADLSYLPRRLPRGRSRRWPSMVLELAFSEKEPKLMSDIRLWFHESKGDVKIVATMRVHRNEPMLTIDTWEANGDGRIHRTQNVTIKKSANKVKASGPIKIEFGKLFLRKTETAQERDMEIDPEDLKYLAEMIWESQNF